MGSYDSNGAFETAFIAVYVYGSQPNDTGQYDLGITTQTGTSEIGGIPCLLSGSEQRSEQVRPV
jgi:hypothetical protein